MARRTTTQEDGAGSDSFLDVTTNIVGILIILVMVVGERAKTAPVELGQRLSDRAALAAEAEAARLDDDVRRLAAQMATVGGELRGRLAERNRLSTLVAAVEHDLALARSSLDSQARARYETDRDLALARNELARLAHQRSAVEKAAAPQTIEIKNYPTPIGKSVDGHEAHFQLLRGRLAYVPYEPLVDRLRAALRESISRMQDQVELVDTLGPFEGFRLQYVIQRADTPGGTYFQVSYVEFVPVSGQLGEPLEEALAPGSKFRELLGSYPPRTYTITVWTYPDSFSDFRRLKQELYSLGYSVAARPLPEGMPIGASPQGTKSSAQ
jgi:hypothetical protein